jgi:hypothetical protein
MLEGKTTGELQNDQEWKRSAPRLQGGATHRVEAAPLARCSGRLPDWLELKPGSTGGQA